MLAPSTAELETAADPAASAVALVQSGIFDTYMVYERAGVWTVAGGCRAAVTVTADQLRVRHNDTDHSHPWRSMADIGQALADLDIPQWTAYGWLTFELTHLLAGRRDLAGPGELAHLIIPQTEVRFGHVGTTVTGADPERVHDVLATVRIEPPARPVRAAIDHGGEWYRRAVTDAVGEIHRGAFQKVILSRRVPVAADIDLPRTYLLGRAANTPARSFLLDIGGRRAAGFCPETILEADSDGVVSTQPLAGTRSRGDDLAENQRLRTELLNDPKEIHEHAVSVKLAYDELNQVCAAGTVVVSDLMSVKPRGPAQHLGSRVRGQLAAHRTAWDALAAVFPAVTASGIPKAAACEYIARAERGPRGLYSGAVLVASHDGALDAGLVLRSVFEENGERWLRAGAGIVSASRPEREYEETCEKLRSVAPHLVSCGHDDQVAVPRAM